MTEKFLEAAVKLNEQLLPILEQHLALVKVIVDVQANDLNIDLIFKAAGLPIRNRQAELEQEVKELKKWKEEALPLLLRYDAIAESISGGLGSWKVHNLERWVRARL